MRRSLLGSLLLCAALASVGSAQSTPSLDRVEELAGTGRTEDARSLLLLWWQDVRPSASRRDVQRGFWLRGRLTVDPVQADLDYRRLAIEYPGGPYSDAALLRLAQSAQARGDLNAAALALRRLRTEYPSSSVLNDAEAWLARVGPLPEPVLPPAPSPGPVSVSPADTVSVPEPPAVRTPFAVQLGAFSDPDRARNVLEALVSSGGAGRLVRVEGSPLVRVRTGFFSTREEAAAEARRLSDQGFAVAVVLDADKERPAGR